MTYEEFLWSCCSAVDDDTEYDMLLFAQHPDGGLHVADLHAGDEALHALAILFPNEVRRFGGMATHTGWAPYPIDPIADSVLVIAVDKDKPAIAAVRRIKEDRRWWRLDSDQLPWFALSTAGSIRKILNGELTSFTVKDAQTGDRNLFTMPREGKLPAVDEHGRI